jgi:hypothetical protein
MMCASLFSFVEAVAGEFPLYAIIVTIVCSKNKTKKKKPPSMLATSNHRYPQEGRKAKLQRTQGIPPDFSPQLPRENLRKDHGNQTGTPSRETPPPR